MSIGHDAPVPPPGGDLGNSLRGRPAVCERIPHFFAVEGGEVERIDPVRAIETPEFAEIVADRGWRPTLAAPARGSNRPTPGS